MKITILCVGKIKEKFYRDAITEYCKRLSRYCKLEVAEVADEKTPDRASEHEELLIKEKEAERMEKYLKDGAYVIALRADYRLSFSKMTFPHQLMRVILLEQIYRGYRIMNHEPYHK